MKSRKAPHQAVDTNVLVAANGRDTHADLECQLASVEILVAIQSDKSLLLDRGGEVLAEYLKYSNFHGQPGVGDEFFRWAFQNQGVLVAIELHEHEERIWVEFPDLAELQDFDPPDRKFVALALSHPNSSVVNALDSDYVEAHTALVAAGVDVIEICSHQLKPAN